MTDPRWRRPVPLHHQFLALRTSHTLMSMAHDDRGAVVTSQLGSQRGGHADAVAAVREYMASLPEVTPFRVEVRSCRFWRAVWTEFLVTLLFLVIGCGAGVHQGEDHLKASLALGLTVAALVQCAVSISGCHLNPAVSIALLVTRVISPLRMVSYVLAQCLGAIIGAAILYALTPPDVRQRGLSPTLLHPGVHPSQAFGVEFLTTLLVLVTLVATYGGRRQVDTHFVGLPVGVAYSVGHLFGYPYTGAGMNPARSLGLAVVTNSWSNHWVYWVGPILGGIIGGITYDYIHDVPISYLTNSAVGRREVTSDGGDKPEANVSVIHETEMTITSNDCRV